MYWQWRPDRCLRWIGLALVLLLHVLLSGNTRLKCVIVPLVLGGGHALDGPDDSGFPLPRNASAIRFLPEQPLVPGMGLPWPAGSCAPAPAGSVQRHGS